MSLETKRISELEELENLDNYPYFLAAEEGVAKRVPTHLVSNWYNIQYNPFVGQDHYENIVYPCKLSATRVEGTNTYVTTVNSEMCMKRENYYYVKHSGYDYGEVMLWGPSVNEDGYLYARYDYFSYNNYGGTVIFIGNPERTIDIKFEFDSDIGLDVFELEDFEMISLRREYGSIDEEAIQYPMAKIEDIPTWETLDNRPFYTSESFTIEYNGARTPYAELDVYRNEGEYLYRISDRIPTEYQMKNASAVYYNADTGESQSFDSVTYYKGIDENGSEGPGKGDLYCLNFGDDCVFIVTGWVAGVHVSDLYPNWMLNFDEPGIYAFGTINGGTSHVESITFPEEVKTIDSEYLPNPLQFGEKTTEVVINKDVTVYGHQYNYSDALACYYPIDVLAMASLSAGDLCKVVINGNETVGVLEEFTFTDNFGGELTIIGFGNKSVINQSAENTGEGFYFTSDGTLYFSSMETRVVSTSHLINSFTTIEPKYIPKAAAVSDAAGENVTASEFNALLTALREAGYLTT